MNSMRWPRRCGRGTTSAPARSARRGRRSGCPRPRPRPRLIDADETSAGSSWRLEFLLQSTEDPSLLVPAEQAWSDDGSLRRWLDRPQELLLTELGRASRIYPELAPGLRTARPSELDLDADGAYRFLSGTRRGARRGRVRRAAAVLVGPAPPARARPVRAHPDRRSGEQAASSVATSWSTSAGSWPSATTRSPRTRSPRSPRRRRRWSGCAASGWRSIPSSCAAGWSSWSASRPAARPRPRSSRWPPATPTTSTPRCGSPLCAPTAGSGDLLAGTAAQSLPPLEPPDGVHRDAAALPAARPVVAGVPVLAGPG